MGVLERTAPSVIASVWAWWKSKKVVVVGQARSGKSTFIDYFQHGTFGAEKETRKTDEQMRTASFTVAVGRDKTLEATLQTVVEQPGQFGAVNHANVVFHHQPQGVLVFTDLTTPLDGPSDRAARAWLLEFCQRLEKKWRASGKKNKNLCSFIVVMNKRDKVDKKDEDEYRAAFQAILKAELRDALGRLESDVEVMPCIAVKSKQKTDLLDAVITQLLKDLAR